MNDKTTDVVNEWWRRCGEKKIDISDGDNYNDENDEDDGVDDDDDVNNKRRVLLTGMIVMMTIITTIWDKQL